ncbi:MAG: fatty acid--CoA ligase family protein [Geopsychrobacter sp.]|nr:fatty acid--CoA ligase family protein [Geopsychrobacter sp.]
MPASPPEQETSLLEIIRSLPSERPLLRTRTLRLSAGETVVRVETLRKNKTVLPGQPALLHGLPILELLLQLIAADGYCSRQLLLPASMNRQQAKQFATKVFSTSPSRPREWLLTTSGTSGAPKLIPHSLTDLGRNLKRNPEIGAAYRWGLVYDPCRFAGLQVTLQAFYSGSELVLAETDNFDLQVQLLVDTEINALSASPTYWRKLAIDSRIKNCPLQQITLGGETVDQKLLDHLRQLFPDARISQIYASTEVGVGFSVTDAQAGFPLSYVTDGTVGTELRISHDNCLWLRSAPAASEISPQSNDDEGFLNSHDLVEVRGDRVFFLGRDNGIINVGGNKVFPEQVERIVREVQGVLEVRVSGKKSPFVGEVLFAEVVSAATDPDLLRKKILEHCHQQLAPWQVPAVIRFADQIKTSAGGKLCRTERYP